MVRVRREKVRCSSGWKDDAERFDCGLKGKRRASRPAERGGQARWLNGRAGVVACPPFIPLESAEQGGKGEKNRENPWKTGNWWLSAAQKDRAIELARGEAN